MKNSQEPITIKLVCVGDQYAGKTDILYSYTTGHFSTDYVSTLFPNYTTQMAIDGKTMVNLTLVDTAGQETYSRLRTLSYGQADIFLIVFSVVDSLSFDNAINKWYPELNAGDQEKVPKIVVGNRTEMREDSNPNHVQKEAAEKVFRELDLAYFECSALTQEGLTRVFDAAVQTAYKVKMKIKSEMLGNIQPIQIEQQDQGKHEELCCIIS